MIGGDAKYVADVAGCDHCLRLAHEWIGAHPHGFHAEQPAPLGFGQHRAALRCGQREGFLDQARFAGAQRQQPVLQMLGVGGGDVDDVHLGVGQQLVVGAVGAGGAEPVAQLGRPLGRSGADGVHGVAGRGGDVPADGRRDPARAQDAPAHDGSRCGTRIRRHRRSSAPG